MITKEEIIEYFRELKRMIVSEERIYFDLTIKALQQPSTEEAIDEACKWLNEALPSEVKEWRHVEAGLEFSYVSSDEFINHFRKHLTEKFIREDNK